MPLKKISTGIDLYYESQGCGEALVFIPGAGFEPPLAVPGCAC